MDGMIHTLGLDLAAGCTGLVVLAANDAAPLLVHEEAVTVKSKGLQRCSDIAERVLWALEKFAPAEVVVEGYAVSRFGGSAIVSIELGAIVRYFLKQNGISWLEPTPTQLKKFVLGKQGDKAMMMLGVYKRWGFEPKCDDTADAYG